MASSSLQWSQQIPPIPQINNPETPPPTTYTQHPQGWRYEMRREAQLIIPNLYLGPFQSSLNREKLKAMGITHILCIRDKKEAALIKPRFPEEFRYLTLDISDNADQNIITIFPSCKAFIDEAMGQGGSVLAHCNGGISVSPAIIVGYLMSKYDWNYENAVNYVQSKRYCVSPISFQIQLKEYEPIYLAQKMIAQAALQSNGNGIQARTKRSMSEDEDDFESDRQRTRHDYMDEDDGMDS